MNELCNLSIKELIESIDENILTTKETRKNLIIERNFEKDSDKREIKSICIKDCDDDLYRFRMQKFELSRMIKEHALYAYKKLDRNKTAQERQVQEKHT